MRILYLTHYFPPEGNAPASRAFQLARRWVADGHSVQVITCAPNVPDGVVYDGYENRPISRERIEGIDVTRVWTYGAPNRGTVRRIANYLSYMVSASVTGLFARKSDVMIATSPQFFAGWAGTIIRKIRRIPFVLEIRDIWPESIAAVGAIENPKILSVLESAERKLYRSSDRIVTVGEGYRDRLLERDVPAGKIDIIPNGVDTTMFTPRPGDPALRQRWALEGKFVCSYVGTIGLCAGLEVVLDAATQLKRQRREDIVFVLVGDGAQRAGLEQRVRQRGLDNVLFTGRQPKQDMPAWLAISDACLVHLKRRDVFRSVYPSKIFEAAAMQRPILLGVEGAAEALIRRAGAGLCFQPESPEQLITSLLQLVDQPALARTLGQQGCRHILKHYNHDQLARKYLQILAAVAGLQAGVGNRPKATDPTGTGPGRAGWPTGTREVRRCA